MKKYIGILLTLILLLTAGSALALTELEWNLRCSHKLIGDATLYECYVAEGEATRTDLHISAQNYVFTPVGTLPSGSYVNITDLGFAGKMEISYYSGGARFYAYVDKELVGDAFVQIRLSKHESYGVPEVCYANPDTWYMVLSEKFGAEKANQIIEALENGGYTDPDIVDKDTSGGSATGGQTKAKAQSAKVRWVDENGEETNVKLETLGTAVSVIVLDGETITVPTSELRWDTTAEEDEMLAVVKAHKSGKASLREKASTKAKVISKVTTNRIVLVMEKGKKFTKVLCDGKVGYIINTALTYYPVGGIAEGEAEPQPGWVSFRGRLKSGNTVNIRQNGKNGSRILTDFVAGTPIMVFSQDKKWTEIDVGGYRAYILNEYVTLDDGTITTE